MRKLNNEIWYSNAIQSTSGKKDLSENSKFAWCLTGSGHYLEESMEILKKMPNTDIFLSNAAEEVLPMYGFKLIDLKASNRIFRDKTSSAVPVGALYKGNYHTVVIAPATSNTVAKCALGLSDTLPTNMFAQAGKLNIPSLVFACDTEPTVITKAPKEWVELKPRNIEFKNLASLKQIPGCRVAETIGDLKVALSERFTEVGLTWKKYFF